MTKADKDRIDNKAGSSSHSYIDDDADFLDDLMDDVMGMDEADGDSMETETGPASESEVLEKEVAPESGDVTQVSDDDDSVAEEQSTGVDKLSEESRDDEVVSSRPRRRGGLLNKFNSSSNGGDDKSSEIESSDRGDKHAELSTADEEPVEKTESTKNAGRRAPLFSVVRSETNSGEDVNNAEENKEGSSLVDNKSSSPIDSSSESLKNKGSVSEDIWGDGKDVDSLIDNKSSSPIEGSSQVDGVKISSPVKASSSIDVPSFSDGDYSLETPEIVGAEEIDPADDENVEENIVEELPSDDLFDDLLEDLTESDDLDKLKKKAKLDPEVKVPLEKPGMDEVIVTSDGKSLADMLPGLRGGNRPIAEVVDKIRNQEKVVEVGGKKFTDDRYTKHAPIIDKEVEEREKRIALSMKFLQRNAEFTEHEKVIMKNLGVTSEQLSQIMRSKELTLKEKNQVLGLGRYGAEKHFKGRRYRTTVGDTAMLEFLVKFKYANTRILRWISNEPQNRTWRKLNRLRNSGLVESKSLIGVPDLWGATPAGTAIAGYSLAPGLRPMPKIPTISSGMGVNYIAACLWFNTVNVLNLEDFPAENRVIALQDDGRDRVRGEMLVSELEIRSSLGKEINPSSTTMQSLGDQRLYDVISENVRVSFEEWEDGGKLGDSPETLLGNEYMWVLFPTSQLTLSYHVPDLVVKRERGPNGEPRSIAIEMERYEKTNDRYDKIMLAYKLDEHLYEKVIWITPNTRVARALEQAAEAVGFDRYSIIPIITETGVYDKQDIWMI